MSDTQFVSSHFVWTKIVHFPWGSSSLSLVLLSVACSQTSSLMRVWSLAIWSHRTMMAIDHMGTWSHGTSRDNNAVDEWNQSLTGLLQPRQKDHETNLLSTAWKVCLLRRPPNGYHIIWPLCSCDLFVHWFQWWQHEAEGLTELRYGPVTCQEHHGPRLQLHI